MLRKLLRLVAEGGVRTRADLSRELGVSEGLVEQMLEDLAPIGYLELVAGGCADQCAACSLAKMCIVGRPGRASVLTARGWSAIPLLPVSHRRGRARPSTPSQKPL